jgi:hypothetical protein
MEEKPFYKSKKFWSMVVNVLLQLFGGKLGLPTAEAGIALGSYTIGQGIADAGIKKVTK